MFDYASRRRALVNHVSEDAFIALNVEKSDPASIRYLTGFTGEGALIASDRETVLLTDSRYTEQATREVHDLRIEQQRAWTRDGLAAVLQDCGFDCVSFPSRRVTYDWYVSLREMIDLDLVPRADPVAELRRVKSPHEIDQLVRAVHLAERALSRLVEELRVGMNEAEVALRLEWLIREDEAEGIAFDINVSAGENTALNHYNPVMGRRLLKAGDLLLLDFGACVNGYRSDLTRTFSVGRAPREATEIYDLVLRANRAAIAAVRGGVTGAEVDAVARDLIASSGHGEHFGHGLGHGIGLEIHEAPTVKPQSEDTLDVGATVTIEPGVYLPGFGGVRIEDDIVVTESGCDILSSFPRDRLMEIG
jgi:Xaa-Pro aminopeptidase